MNKPCFKADGKTYEFIYTRHLQAEWDDMTRAMRDDEEYQRGAAKANRKNTEFQNILNRYEDAQNAFLDDPLNEEKEKVYEKLKAVYEKAYEEYCDFIVKDDTTTRSKTFIVDSGEKLVLSALQEQYNLSEEAATEVWETYVSENSHAAAIEWISYFIDSFFGETPEEETDNPFVKRAREKARQSGERRRGLKTLK